MSDIIFALNEISRQARSSKRKFTLQVTTRGGKSITGEVATIKSTYLEMLVEVNVLRIPDDLSRKTEQVFIQADTIETFTPIWETEK